MESIKKEQNLHLQTLSAQRLARALEMSLEREVPSPGVPSKVVRNLVSFAYQDPAETPQLNADTGAEENKRILTLQIREAKSVKKVARARRRKEASQERSSASPEKKAPAARGRKPKNGGSSRGSPAPAGQAGPSSSGSTEAQQEQEAAAAAAAAREAEVQAQSQALLSRGARIALEAIVRHFHVHVFDRIPMLDELTFKTLEEDPEVRYPVDLALALRALEIIAPVMPSELLPKLVRALEPLVQVVLQDPHAALRHLAAREGREDRKTQQELLSLLQ